MRHERDKILSVVIKGGKMAQQYHNKVCDTCDDRLRILYCMACTCVDPNGNLTCKKCRRDKCKWGERPSIKEEELATLKRLQEKYPNTP